MRASEFSDRKYAGSGDGSFTNTSNQKPPSAVQGGPETFNQTVPDEINMCFGMTHAERKE